MDKILFNAMLSKIQKEIISNREEIESIYKIDKKYCIAKLDLSKTVNVIENYKNKKFNSQNKKIMIYCNGNPYIVLNLAMIAICANISIFINIDDTMLGVNECILSIINDILKNNRINIEIKISKEEDINKAIFIDRVNDYTLLNKKIKYTKFIPYQSIDIYCDSEEYEELYEMVYEYAINLNIDIDIFDKEEGIESILKYGKSRNVLIFTKNKIDIKDASKKIYINENPFLNEDLIFDQEMIKNIIN